MVVFPEQDKTDSKLDQANTTLSEMWAALVLQVQPKLMKIDPN